MFRDLHSSRLEWLFHALFSLHSQQLWEGKVLIFFLLYEWLFRHAPLIEFLPSVVLVFLCLALFHIITIHPARLHNQVRIKFVPPIKWTTKVKKTRALFCSNIRQWIPYGQSVSEWMHEREEDSSQVHTAALVLSSHLEQNDVGVTIWGFALLSKPLILTVSLPSPYPYDLSLFQSLSAMTTALAIFLQFSDCKKQIETNFQNATIFELMNEI